MAKNHTAWSRVSPADVTLEWPMKEITSRLLDNFERLSEAPDALPRLRRFVLDLAVWGKLVQQDPNDEPASTALRGINAYALSNGAFPLPASWAWIDVASVAETRLGKMLDNSKNKGTPRPYLRNINVRWFGFDLTNLLDMPFEDAELAEFELRDGDVLICEGGEPGRAAVWDKGNQDIYFQKAIHRVRFAQVVVPRFFVKALKVSADDGRLTESLTGTGIKHLTGRSLSTYRFPLPPLAEQHRIVAKVDELMTLCDRLEAAQNKREQRRDRLVAASLNRINRPAPTAEGEAATAFCEHARFHLDHLPRLTTRAEHIKSLRQTILNLAIRGKLAPQDRTDEPALKLLKRIAAEKARLVKAGEIKRESSLPLLSESEMAFEIPRGWGWARLGDLSKLVTSGSRDWAKHYSKEGAIFVRMGNLSKNDYRLRLENVQRVTPPPGGEGTRTRLEAGDILISITGDVGMLGLIPDGFGEAYINQHTAMVRPMPEMRGRYLAELFRSPFAQDQFNEPQRGIKNSFRLTDVTQFVVPLPPLAEQHRIVAKVDELMAVCDQLETQLTATRTDSRRLLEAVLKAALAPAMEEAA